ncbi:uncharacterized protein LOC132739859 [Ruditapes philippinarum]|uniref:uncharacterized protein LOC132739859 n=1 Tax=Ruditapes philippinarum TaxID=129788 RepID=UPI00295B4A4B|nr:uncharacterized protein LOC132739859 [Ruditapes philippinarum]
MALLAGFVIINFVLLGTVYSSTCKPFQINKDNLNKALIGHSVREINDTNHQECARTCMSMSVCKSIDYDRPENICKLNGANRSSVDPLEFETKTMVGSCSSRPCKANQQCYQKGASHVCKLIIPWTCKDVKLCRPSYTDGEYWLYSRVLGSHMVKLYCAGMSAEEPLEYISVNEKDNYGFSAGNLGSKKGLTRYQKIRVDLMEGKIIRNDTIFSTTCTQDISDLPPLPYGRGGGCSCEYCAKGNFSISLQGTGLKISKEVYIFHLLGYMISDEDFMIGCYSATFCYESTNVPKFRLCPKNNQCHSVTMACKQKCLMTTNTNRNKPKLHL